MNYLTFEEVVQLHDRLIEESGGSYGIRDEGAVQSAIDQPRMTMFGADLYESVVDKAVALGFSLIQNHGFIDGNKRIGQAAMERFLMHNGYEIDAPTDEQEAVILNVASGTLSREELTDWVYEHLSAVP